MHSARALPEVLGGVSADLRQVFGAKLSSYNNRVRSTIGRQKRPKIINDSIWKTVRLEWCEMLVLDSPPVQRLRNVAQLGLAHLVYPGAGYSRFEHSIGVLYQTQRIVDSINHNARSAGRSIDPISRSDESLLRLAGLLHDIGHGFLSHVSERAMSRIEQLPHGGTASQARDEAEAFFRCRKTPSFSEVLASLIVLLPEFVELLELASVPSWDDSQSLADHIAHLIVGSTPYSSRPFLSEIISGSVDADKLDYMARDCFSAGLPMPVDVERLLQKLQAVAVSTDSELGKPWAHSRELSPNESIYMMAIDERGGIAAEELVVSRVLLYDKLYHHQKVRGFEGLVEHALDLLVAGTKAFKSPATFLSISDADFLEGKAWPIASTDDEAQIKIAREVVLRIHNRHEMVRAAAFGPSMIETPSDDTVLAWQDLKPYVTRERTDEAAEFIVRVVDKAKEYLRLGGRATDADTLRKDSIIVDLPEPQGISEKTRFLVGNEQTGLRQYSVAARIDRWAEAYEEGKSIGYVYAPAEHALAVHLAFRYVVKELSAITFQDRQLTLTKIFPQELIEFRNLLASRRSDVPDVIAPQGLEYIIPPAERAEIERVFGATIQRLAERFQSFESPDSIAIDSAHITNFLLQFNRDDIPLVIRVLENIRYWTRQRIVDAFQAFFKRTSSKHPVVQLAALGGQTTSAGMIKYFIEDFRTNVRVELRVLESLEDVEENVPVVFLDDFIGSGIQSRTVIQQWFGIDRSQWFINERHVDPLSKDARERLASCEIMFAFLAGKLSGIEALCSFATNLQGGKQISGWIAQPQDFSCFSATANVFQRSDQARKAEEIFRRTGRQALSDEPWPEDKISDRVLGYGNNADLNVFFYNVPSSTLTSLWKKCDRADAHWLPLFRRRKRPGLSGHEADIPPSPMAT